MNVTMKKDDIAKLRELTGAGIMDCKMALTKAKGDFEKAREILKAKGLDLAKKKAGREAKEGQIVSYVHAGGKIAALVEVNCETDFVARNEIFQRFAKDVAMQVAAQTEDIPLLDQKFIKDPTKTIRDYLTETIARLGENILIRRCVRFELGIAPHIEDVTAG
ncbi:MAG: translation elongation factor Ts [Candidatus Omnitrophica bacterium]|nr:translation elongation factor Ts [Candidatus Omnitrophota bacterium]